MSGINVPMTMANGQPVPEFQRAGKFTYDELGVPVSDPAQCGTCGRWWDDAIITATTPAPGGCPFEHEHATEPLSDAEQFFYDNAGYSYDPATESREEGRARCARALAAAEDYGRRHGWRVEYDEDPDVMEDDVDSVGMVARGEAVNLTVTLRDADGEFLGSLAGVVVPNDQDPYLRAVAAQLMEDAMPDESGSVRLSNVSNVAAFGVEWEQDGTTFQLVNGRGSCHLFMGMRPAKSDWWSDPIPVFRPDRFGFDIYAPPLTYPEFHKVALRFVTAEQEQGFEAVRSDIP